MVEHKCADCGYLAVRDLETRELEEAERDEKGNIIFPRVPKLADRGMLVHLQKYDSPVCFARNSNLQSEYGVKPTEGGLERTWYAKIQEVVTRPRPCDRFTEWQQGLTPKEHREMRDRQWMLEMEERRRRNDRKWHWIELFAIVLGTGLFTLLGVWIS